MFSIRFVPLPFLRPFYLSGVIANSDNICLKVQERFEVDIKALPDQIDTSIYSKYRILWSLTGIHGTEVCCHLKCWCVVLCWLMYSAILRIQVKDSLLQRIILGWLLDNLVSPEDVPSVLIRQFRSKDHETIGAHVFRILFACHIFHVIGKHFDCSLHPAYVHVTCLISFGSVILPTLAFVVSIL